MQLIWVSGPVGRIYKLDLTLKKLIIGLFVTIFLSSLFYFLSQANWLRQDTDFAEYEELSTGGQDIDKPAPSADL
jgi:hypothetical protein